MKLRKLFSVLLAVVLIGTAMSVTTASAADYYREQIWKYNEMKARTIKVSLDFSGGYVLKSTKLYGRKVTGVAPDGNFILGPWEVLHSDTYVPLSFPRLTIDGTYIQFAYSVDIMWGTDFPYSGIFKKDVDTPVEDINIILAGTVRNVSVHIYVNEGSVYKNDNCSPHSEWTP